MNNGIEQIVSLSKDNMEAVVKSSTLAAKGFEELSKVYAAFATANFEKAQAAAKVLMGSKSATEFQSVYTKLAKDSLESFVSDSRKLAEATQQIMTQAVEPLSGRMQALQALAKVNG